MKFGPLTKKTLAIPVLECQLLFEYPLIQRLQCTDTFCGFRDLSSCAIFLMTAQANFNI
jgi:hypothetical protein